MAISPPRAGDSRPHLYAGQLGRPDGTVVVQGRLVALPETQLRFFKAVRDHGPIHWRELDQLVYTASNVDQPAGAVYSMAKDTRQTLSDHGLNGRRIIRGERGTFWIEQG